MTTAAGFGRYDPLPPINAGPSLRTYRPTRQPSTKAMSSSSPERAPSLKPSATIQKPPATAAAAAAASTSPRKKQVKKKGAHLPEVPNVIADVENGVEHLRGRLLGQVSGVSLTYAVSKESANDGHNREGLREYMRSGAQMVVHWHSRRSSRTLWSTTRRADPRFWPRS